MQQKPSKHFILRHILEQIEKNPEISIVDFGSGNCSKFVPLLQQHPELRYTGVEPNPAIYKRGEEALKPFKNAKVVNSLAYTDCMPEHTYDIVLSLSVLEHVKHLDKFMKLSCDYVKPGGSLVHLYDLGHYLYPHNILEYLQTRVCSHKITRWIASELHYAGYVDLHYVKELITQNNMTIKRTTSHNQRFVVSTLKKIPDSPEHQHLLDTISQWEVEASSLLEHSRHKEKLFPSICVWAEKNAS